MVRITVMGEKEAERLLSADSDVAAGSPELEPMIGCFLIAIRSNDREKTIPYRSDTVSSVLRLQFDDVEAYEEGSSGFSAMTRSDASAAVDFAREADSEGAPIVVHCEGGVSRSAGTAAALAVVLGGDDSFIFSDPRYVPNMTCYRRVLEAAGLSLTEEQELAKEKENRDAWEIENRGF